jgi:CRISPR-associated endonuclease/helicase Cas3
LNEALKLLFGEDAPETVLAVPGYLKVGEVRGQTLPEWKVRWEDNGDADEAKLLARWAAESAKRFLAATIAVGTVDQARSPPFRSSMRISALQHCRAASSSSTRCTRRTAT